MQTKQNSDDYYLDEQGRLVFTAAYHLKRGYCCGCGCRHCPYGHVNVRGGLKKTTDELPKPERE